MTRAAGPCSKRHSARRAVACATLVAASLSAGAAGAQYRLRADAYYAAADPATGLLVLSGESRTPSWLEADAVVWLGTGDHRGDVMVASVRAKEPNGWGEIRAGRFLETAGGLRPLHLDGGDVIARAPWGTSVEVFGGAPVVSEFQTKEYDWAAGGRIAQRIGRYGTVGVSYLQLRQAGALTYEEVGVDAAATPLRWLDAAFSGSIDLVALDLSDARVSLAARFDSLRLELFAVRRSPSHLLPATSLFSALGDMTSQRAGASLLWRAAPRLDVLAQGTIEALGGASSPEDVAAPPPSVPAQVGGQAMLRATLRLDDRGDGALGLDLRRESVPGWPGVPSASWTGVRGTARVPLNHYFTASTEIELVAPDVPRGRGAVWPWALVALKFRPEPKWEIAGAVEAGASPTAVSQVSGVFRVSYAWGNK
ncbi:MAG: hypothetical protein QM820_00605 [Minicystis sp.]